jgi:hypothetical protein
MPGAALNQRVIEPLISTGLCRRGAIAYEPLVGTAVQQDFLGILFGDVTGNWQPPPVGAALRAQTGSAYRLRVRSARPAGMGGALRLPLAIKGSEPFVSLDVTVTYDSELLRPISVKKLRAAGNAVAVFNLSRPGVVRIAVPGQRTKRRRTRHPRDGRRATRRNRRLARLAPRRSALRVDRSAALKVSCCRDFYGTRRR